MSNGKDHAMNDVPGKTDLTFGWERMRQNCYHSQKKDCLCNNANYPCKLLELMIDFSQFDM